MSILASLSSLQRHLIDTLKFYVSQVPVVVMSMAFAAASLLIVSCVSIPKLMRLQGDSWVDNSESDWEQAARTANLTRSAPQHLIKLRFAEIS
ncbi:hypothetical protein N8586_03435 [Verrucomicrobiales bacterium]|nr:hypothetical protein [Verrucomicrobiales bacterium]